MIRRPPRSTRKESSAASDVYKRQEEGIVGVVVGRALYEGTIDLAEAQAIANCQQEG